MYLRAHRRSINGIAYEYWTLVESRRTASGPRQHTVATLGKLPGLDDAVHAGWEPLMICSKAARRHDNLSCPPVPSAAPRGEVTRGVRSSAG
jgi:hypothetical protein